MDMDMNEDKGHKNLQQTKMMGMNFFCLLLKTTL